MVSELSGRYSEYVVHLCRYVHLNPVAAGLVSDPADWPYSNYLEWIERRPGTLVDRAFVRQFFPMPSAYVAFVQDRVAPGLAQQLRPYVLDGDDVPESGLRGIIAGSLREGDDRRQDGRSE